MFCGQKENLLRSFYGNRTIKYVSNFLLGIKRFKVTFCVSTDIFRHAIIRKTARVRFQQQKLLARLNFFIGVSFIFKTGKKIAFIGKKLIFSSNI